MTAQALDDRTFLVDGRPYLNARQAAIYCGFEPAPLGTRRQDDPQMRAFGTWASSRGLRTQPGRLVYRRTDLDAAIQRTTPGATSDAVRAARQLARDDVADRRRQARRLTLESVKGGV